MPVETLKRGRGPAKNRTDFQEIDYTVSCDSVYQLTSSGIAILSVLNLCLCLVPCSSLA